MTLGYMVHERSRIGKIRIKIMYKKKRWMNKKYNRNFKTMMKMKYI